MRADKHSNYFCMLNSYSEKNKSSAETEYFFLGYGSILDMFSGNGYVRHMNSDTKAINAVWTTVGRDISDAIVKVKNNNSII